MSSHSSDSMVTGPGVTGKSPKEIIEDIEKTAADMQPILETINESQALLNNLEHLQKLGGTSKLAKKLHTCPERGIDAATADTRQKHWGTNAMPATPRKDFWTLFVETFDDATLQILIVAAVVSLSIGLYDDPATGYVEGCAILAACLIVSVVTAINDYQKESQFRQLSVANDAIDVVVIRDGLHWQIAVHDIVVGDLVVVEAGDPIPCDGVLVRMDDIQLDESALTGEPIEVDKNAEEDPFVLSGCTVVAGSGHFIAIAVGKHSQWGIIQSHLEKEQDQTPLQEKLDEMAANIGYVGMGAAALTFIAMMSIKIWVDPVYLQHKSLWTHALDAFIIGVTIVVVAVPEGLPLAVTISLAFSTKKMLADQNLIRHLAACETMGNATNICSDKTGTLTENKMTVVKGVFADTRHEDVAHSTRNLKISDKAQHVLLEGIACCTTAKLVPPVDGSKDDRSTWIGSKTEAAMLHMASSVWGAHDDWESRRATAQFGTPSGSRLFPFSSARKRMSVLVVTGGSDDDDEEDSLVKRVTRSATKKKVTHADWTLYHKGAAEMVLENCTLYLDADGKEKPLTKAKREQFEKVIREYARGALRCVALAHRNNIQDYCNDPHKIHLADVESELEEKMCLDALVGIADPLRPDVIDAVATCQRAGIFVRMVTGDNLETAIAIAKEAGILKKGGLAMTGEEFRKLTPAQLDEKLPLLQVLARSSPEDKHMLVQRLNGGLMPENKEQWLEAHPGKNYEKERDLLLPGYKEEWAVSRGGVGEVVGVTGDGTNDGPALKAADVGMSMGLSGTDVAKKASDIIIMDDNFASIVKAVLWGRSVFDNIRKFLQFQLTVNVVALTITFLAAVSGYNPPLNAVMMLWVNLIMDTMGALALGTEPPEMELLERRPYRRNASLVSRPMWRNILVQATYQLAMLVFLLRRPDLFDCEDGSTHHFTIIFNAFVFCQVFNEFNAREIGDLFAPMRYLSKSPMFLLVIAFTAIAQWFIVEYGGDFTQTTPLNWEEWKITVGLGAISLPMGFIMRIIPVAEDPATFAGIGGKGDTKRDTNWLRVLILVLFPVLCAIVYLLVQEVQELKEDYARYEAESMTAEEGMGQEL